MVLAFSAFAVLMLRLWFLQILQGPTFREKSENNRIRLRDIAPFRGMILDRNGEVLADNRPAYDLYFIPEEVQDQDRLLNELSQMTGLDPLKARAAIDKTGARYPFLPVCLIRDMQRDQLAKVETHLYDMPGLFIQVQPQRHYVWDDFATHLIGYVGEITEQQLKSGRFADNKAGDLIGKSGIEARWQTHLGGVRGGEQVEVDASGRQIRVVSRKAPLPGANVHLTIDRRLQTVAEDCLADKTGAIVALDPTSGQVLALASSPDYDPNVFVGGIDRTLWKAMISAESSPLQNRALCGQYPPGSIFKIVVALAGLQEGLITPSERIFCNGVYAIGNYKYRCWRRQGHGHVDLHQALVQSCDVYFYLLGKKLGIERIARYARAFGLGQTTGFDAGDEKTGLIPDNEWKKKTYGVSWQLGETLISSIGQSFVLVTPIQMATLFSAVFNGGVIYQPQVTKEVVGRNNETIFRFEPVAKQKVPIDKAHLERVKQALVGVVEGPRGTGSQCRIEGCSVAGKTGTAQVIALEKAKHYEDESDIPWRYRDHAWFVAVAPAEDPRIAVAVLVEHGGHGGSAAAPLAKTVIESYLESPMRSAGETGRPKDISG
ncbi:Penicillin-binding protein 2 [uncultured Desulfatiglans sp.]|nr:Penicillin-binding protein 2 [uncultured Desulfatiglans sp.]